MISSKPRADDIRICQTRSCTSKYQRVVSCQFCNLSPISIPRNGQWCSGQREYSQCGHPNQQKATGKQFHSLPCDFKNDGTTGGDPNADSHRNRRYTNQSNFSGGDVRPYGGDDETDSACGGENLEELRQSFFSTSERYRTNRSDVDHHRCTDYGHDCPCSTRKEDRCDGRDDGPTSQQCRGQVPPVDLWWKWCRVPQ